MTDPTPAPPVSPTGTPVLDPKWVPLLLGLSATFAAGLGILQQSITNPAGKLACTLALTVLTTVTGILSPGLRRAVPLVLLALVFAASPARAQVLVSSGPTLPLLEVRPGNPHPVSLAAGAGVQLSLTLPQLQRAVAGKAWDLLDLNLMAFGTAVSSSSGATFGAFSAAVGLCTLSSLICIGGGHDIATAPGLKPGWFGLFALSVNFAGTPAAPPVGIERGAQGLARGNHLYFGAP